MCIRDRFQSVLRLLVFIALGPVSYTHLDVYKRQLLRYASEQGWLRMPIELRLAGISAVALAGLVFAWRKRESHRSFALALQGGAIGVLLLVTFAAAKLYALIDPAPAFAISVMLIAGLAVMAVSYTHLDVYKRQILWWPQQLPLPWVC